jgi:hypothetical protein
MARRASRDPPFKKHYITAVVMILCAIHAQISDTTLEYV